jgi:hypothetical protein
MFLTKEEAKENIKCIIADDIDNEIVFVVAHKGVGKTELLEEIYGSASFNSQIVIADGKRIIANAPCINRCFADGILTYLSRHNSAYNRKKLCKYLRSHISNSLAFITVARRKLKIHAIASVLCSLSLNELKNVYYNLAGNAPLVIVSSAMSLTDEEIRYLKELQNDKLGCVGARTTFIVGVRATPQNLGIIDEIAKSKTNGILIMPLLPKIENKSTASDPRSISSISIKGFGIINNVRQLQEKIFSNSVYFDTYEIVRHLSNNHFGPCNLFILANQEVSLKDYEYICDITKIMYKTDLPDYESRLILPNNGKLLWLDVLSYYLALQKGIDEAINETQHFFLGIISEITTSNNKICFGKPSRNAFISFIKNASSIKGNVLAEGFARYYSDFASLIRILFLGNNWSYQDSLMAVEVLDRIVLEFSIGSINAILNIYKSTQICFVLDIGLNTIKNFIQGLPHNSMITHEKKMCIENFMRICMLEAYKWHDITLINEIVCLGSIIKAKEFTIRFKFDELTKNENMSAMYECFIHSIKKYNLKVGDLIMPKKTIFLSYAQKNSKIADGIDSALQDLNFDVKRDVRDVEKWDSLKEFMKTIRKEDYVVFLVSDTYLRRDNCLFEVMQFLKDEQYEKRAFPIAINFTATEQKQRLDAGYGISMFKPEYIAEIVLFWQNRSKNLANMINQLSPENRAELDVKYREIAKMAQTASEFLSNFFGDKLLMTINPDTPRYKDISTEIDKKINEN